MNYINVKLDINQNGTGTFAINDGSMIFNDLQEFQSSGERLGGIVYDFMYQIVGGMFTLIGLRNIPDNYAGICLDVHTDMSGHILLTTTETGTYDGDPLVNTVLEPGNFVRTYYPDGSQYGGYPIDQFVPETQPPLANLANPSDTQQEPEQVADASEEQAPTEEELPVVENGPTDDVVPETKVS